MYLLLDGRAHPVSHGGTPVARSIFPDLERQHRLYKNLSRRPQLALNWATPPLPTLPRPSLSVFSPSSLTANMQLYLPCEICVCSWGPRVLYRPHDRLGRPRFLQGRRTAGNPYGWHCTLTWRSRVRAPLKAILNRQYALRVPSVNEAR